MSCRPPRFAGLPLSAFAASFAALAASCGDDDGAGGRGTSGAGSATGAGGAGGAPVVCLDGLPTIRELSLATGAGVSARITSLSAASDGGAYVVIDASVAAEGDATLTLGSSLVTVAAGPGGSSGQVVVRLSPDGAVAWSRFIRGDGPGTVVTRLAPAGGGAVVAGEFDHDALDVAGSPLARDPSGSASVYAAELDAAGGVAWARVLGPGSATEPGTTLRSLAAGPGAQAWLGVDFEAPTTLDGQPIGAPALLSLAAGGDLAWVLLLEPGKASAPDAMTTLPDGGVRAIGGYVSAFSIGGLMVLKDPFLDDQVFVLEVAPNGAPVSARPMRNPDTLSGDLHRPRFVTPGFVVADAIKDGSVRGSFAAALGAAGDFAWSDRIGAVSWAAGAVELPGTALAVLGFVEAGVCDAPEARSALTMVRQDGAEAWRAPVGSPGARSAMPVALAPSGPQTFLVALEDRVLEVGPAPP
jgi:hypothetical protein